jgi:hypothetical protein
MSMLLAGSLVFWVTAVYSRFLPGERQRTSKWRVKRFLGEAANVQLSPPANVGKSMV